MVNFLAKWLSQSNMAFIFLNFMHFVHTSEIHAKINTKWLSFLSKFKDNTFTRIQSMHSFTINLTHWLTFSVILLITCLFSSNDCKLDQNKHLIIPIHSIHTFAQSIQTQPFLSNKTTTKSNSTNSLFKQAFCTSKIKWLKSKQLKHKSNSKAN